MFWIQATYMDDGKHNLVDGKPVPKVHRTIARKSNANMKDEQVIDIYIENLAAELLAEPAAQIDGEPPIEMVQPDPPKWEKPLFGLGYTKNNVWHQVWADSEDRARLEEIENKLVARL